MFQVLFERVLALRVGTARRDRSLVDSRSRVDIVARVSHDVEYIVTFKGCKSIVYGRCNFQISFSARSRTKAPKSGLTQDDDGTRLYIAGRPAYMTFKTADAFGYSKLVPRFHGANLSPSPTWIAARTLDNQYGVIYRPWLSVVHDWIFQVARCHLHCA